MEGGTEKIKISTADKSAQAKATAGSENSLPWFIMLNYNINDVEGRTWLPVGLYLSSFKKVIEK